MHPDVIIVGGGSAGAVLANRLSADSTRKVMLLEAGHAYSPTSYPEVLTNPDVLRGDSDHDWGYQSEAQNGHRVAASSGKVLGGGSAVNAAVAMRGRRFDFDRWKVHGVDGWDFEEVLKAYKALENTPTGAENWHGRSGPFPIRQQTRDDVTPSLRAFVETAIRCGISPVDDFNGRTQEGVAFHPLNVLNGVRQNTGMVYLSAPVRQRPNLTIRGDSLVDKVEFDSRKAIIVRLANGDVLHAGEIILSAGVYGTPAILLRSGIGPAAHLGELGIPVLADLPVGAKLYDHPFYYNIYALKRESGEMHPANGATIWTKSREASSDELDLQITASHYMDSLKTSTGHAIILGTAVMMPKSVGRLRLKSRDPLDHPLIEYNLLSHDADRRRMLEGVTLSRQIGRTSPLAEFVEHEMTPGPEVVDDHTLEALVRANLDTYHHGAGTVPMGGDADQDAVVDARGRVQYVERLRVVDASIFPEMLSEPINLTVIMAAEHIAPLVGSAGSNRP